MARLSASRTRGVLAVRSLGKTWLTITPSALAPMSLMKPEDALLDTVAMRALRAAFAQRRHGVLHREARADHDEHLGVALHQVLQHGRHEVRRVPGGRVAVELAHQHRLDAGVGETLLQAGSGRPCPKPSPTCSTWCA